MAPWTRHLTLLVDGNFGKTGEEARPFVELDLFVGVSSLLFLLPSIAFYHVGDAVGAYGFALVTVTSFASDALFHNYSALNLLDRYVACLCYGYISYFATTTIMASGDGSETKALKLAAELALWVYPIYWINRSRNYKIGSPIWRNYHFVWHVAASVCAAFGCLLASGVFDEHLKRAGLHVEGDAA